MAKTIAAEIVDQLVLIGVQRVHGVVGDSLNGITEEIRQNKKIEWVHYRHEETAAFAAGAEAQLTGKLAVCAGSCGPGTMHLINGLYDEIGRASCRGRVCKSVWILVVDV